MATNVREQEDIPHVIAGADSGQTSEFSLREWSQQINLLSQIPEKAQRRFVTLDLHLTCIGVISDYIALGTNVGLIYWYNRQSHGLERLNLERGNMSPISCINVVSCENYMIAAGNKDGLINIFQLPKKPADELALMARMSSSALDFTDSRKAQVFTVRDIHKVVITAVHWSSNGMKLFSGDISGVVAETQIDFSSGISKSSKLFDENYQIVQLSYMNQNLLVSSIQKSFIYSNKTKQVTKVGNQDRKSPGTLGGVFAAGLWSKHLKLFAARPGLRLWVADQEGSVQNTLLFKDLVKQSHPSVPIINRVISDIEEKNLSLEKQFGVLLNFMGKFLVTWHNNILYVLDPVNVKVICSCSQLKSIVAVDVHKDEIFVVETNRNIVRIAVKPEEVSLETNYKILTETHPGSKSDFKLPEQPLKLIASKIKETSRALPKFNSSTLINTVRNVLEADLNIQDGLPHVISLKAPEVSQTALASNYSISPRLQNFNSQEIEKFSKISQQSFQDVLHTQFKPEKKKFKKRTFDAMTDSISLSSQGSNNSEVISDLPSEKDKKSYGTAGSVSSSTAPTDQMPNFERQPSVSPTELRSKEEMLAKMLNWSEFLHEPMASSMTGRSGSDGTKDTKPPSVPNVVDNSAPLETLRSYENDVQTNDNCLTPTFENGENVLTGSTLMNPFSIQECIANSHYEESITADMRDVLNSNSPYSANDFDDDRFPLGIYDDTTSTLSQTIMSSLEFFGPPSGSSNVTLIEPETVNSIAERGIELQSMATILSVQDMRVTGVPLNDNWVKYELPSTVTYICCNEKYLSVIDAQHSVYYSSLTLPDKQLCWIKAGFQAVQIASSSDGNVIWKIDPSGTLSTMRDAGKEPYFGSMHWEVICEKAKHAAIRNGIGFVLKTDNSLHLCQVDEGEHIPLLEVLQTPAPLSSIHIHDESVWGLANDGRIFYRSGVTPEKLHGDLWNELRLSISPVASLCLGPQGSLWIADVNNQISFIDAFRQTSTWGECSIWRVTISDELFLFTTNLQPRGHSSLIQWTQKLTDSFRWTYTHSNGIIPNGSLPLLASSHKAISFTVQGGRSIFVNKQCASGHKWDQVPIESSGLKNWKWGGVYAGSIYNDHGYLWLEETNGKLFYLQAGKGSLQPMDMPCVNVAHVATAPEAIWILDGQGTVYARCNVNAGNELGNGWDEIERSLIGDDRKLIHISCGSEVVWSCDDKGDIYIRNGSLNPPSPTDFSPAWIHVEGSPTYSQDAIFTKVFVGPSDRIVWALDSRGRVYAREAVFPDFNIGTEWVWIPSVEATTLAISESAVWALSVNGEVFRRCGISNTNFVGDNWIRIPGCAKALTVSVCDEVWILDDNGILLKHSMEILYLHTNQVTTSREPISVGDDSDSTEWEFLG